MASEISSLSMRSARRSSVMCAACWRSASRSLTPVSQRAFGPGARSPEATVSYLALRYLGTSVPT